MLSRPRMILAPALSPPPPVNVSRLDRRHTGKTEKERQLAHGRMGGRGGGRTNSYDDSAEAWSSMIHLILSDLAIR
jgi:hypothetical protein